MKVNDENGRIISQRHGSANPDPDPDPHQNVMDPLYWFVGIMLGYMNYQQVYMSQWYHRPIPDRGEGESRGLYIVNECHSRFALLAEKSLNAPKQDGGPKK